MKLQSLFDEAVKKWPLLDFRPMWLKAGIIVIKPKCVWPKGGRLQEDGAFAQSQYIAEHLFRIASHFGARLAFWDTVTADTKRILQELALLEMKSSRGKKYEVAGNDEILARLAQPSLPQWGMMQLHMRHNVRDPIVFGTPTCNVLMTAHQDMAKRDGGKDADGDKIYIPVMHGPNAGGPSSVEHWGTDFRMVNRVYVEKERRFLQLQEMTDKHGIPFAARTNASRGDLKTHIEIPKGFAGCVEAWKKILDAMYIFPGEEETRGGFLSGTIYGLQGSGKTWWTSCLMGVPGMLPAIVIASDGGSEGLGSVPSEIKENEFDVAA